MLLLLLLLSIACPVRLLGSLLWLRIALGLVRGWTVATSRRKLTGAAKRLCGGCKGCLRTADYPPVLHTT